MTQGPRAVVVMAKRPDPGTTKTRLHEVLTPAEAAELYECFLLDVLDLVRSVPAVDVVIAAHPPGSESYFTAIAPDAAVVVQVGDDLGQRLDNVLCRCLDDGYDRVAAIGSDSPNLPASRIDRAFELLDDPAVDLVLGPADDGGYYLIAVTRRPGPVVTGVTMSTATVLDDTLRAAADRGLAVGLLDRWYDVDGADDLERLRADLDATAADDRSPPVRTRHLLGRLARRRRSITDPGPRP